MAQRYYRLGLTSGNMPLLSSQQGSVVISSQPEEFSQGDNRPGLLYCDNVMPTNYGLASVGFRDFILPQAATFTELDVREVLSSTKTKHYLAISQSRFVYVKVAEQWLPVVVPFTHALTPADHITTGTVNGVTYIHIRNVGVYVYVEASRSLQLVTLNGINLATVICIAASSGYLLAFSSTSVAWSSTIDATDFVPSATTGAGGGNIAGLQGEVKFAVPNLLGLIIYSESNAVAAIYSGNAQYPFKLSPIPNSKGGISLTLAAYEANSAEQFVYTEAGLQAITVQKAVNVLPEVTDFLSGGLLESFDTGSKKLVQQRFTAELKKQVKFIGARYLVISYGAGAIYTNAIVYDAMFERYGKLRLDHLDAFEYAEAGEAQLEPVRTSVAFVDSKGKATLLSFDSADVTDSVLVLGKFQASRGKLTKLHTLQLANRDDTAPDVSAAFIARAPNGTELVATGAKLPASLGFTKFATQLTGVHISAVLEGAIDISSAEITYSLAGSM